MKEIFFTFLTLFFLWAPLKSFSSAIDQVKRLEGLGNTQSSDTRFEDHYQKLKTNPKDVQSHIDLGKLYQEKKLYELALASFRRALEMDSECAEAHYQISLVYQKLKLKKAELTELILAVKKAPQRDKYHYHLGELYMRKEHYNFKLAKSEYKILKKLGSPLAKKLGFIMGFES